MNSSIYKLKNGVYGPDCQTSVISPTAALKNLKAGDRARKVTCIICQNEFYIPPWDYRYRELKKNRHKPCVCERCGQSLQKEAMVVTGLSPEDLEKLDRMDHIIR